MLPSPLAGPPFWRCEKSVEKLIAKMDGPVQSLGNGFEREPSGQTEARQAAIHAWEDVQNRITSRHYNGLILDELACPFHFKWLDVKELNSLILPIC